MQISDRTTEIIQITVHFLLSLIQKIIIFLLHRGENHVEFRVEWRDAFDLRISQMRVEIDGGKHVDNSFTTTNKGIEFAEYVHFTEIELTFGVTGS